MARWVNVNVRLDRRDRAVRKDRPALRLKDRNCFKDLLARLEKPERQDLPARLDRPAWPDSRGRSALLARLGLRDLPAR
ncbi:hypothetical protein [Paenibacillus glycinis]|uniref:Uncharacterized protein n=1 Tax=Paenibacillus glycinis TaxID=2697035 RepID=A0ABW9XKM4_9BACL|nr:hypothetical protein [Paenibacillus glycinis]NBD23147.1 hypothetical protein [Paenibacillus glycinis]